jgi:hypothetical protein
MLRANTAVLPAPAAPVGWIRDRPFDLGLIAGTSLVAGAVGAAVLSKPALFMPLLLADLWLLGYHHVIATYTRLCFDRASARAHWSLLTWVPLAIVAAVLALTWGVGLWTLTSIYLYWQWWHYTRQSWGVAQIYRRKAGMPTVEDPRLYQAAFYLLPLWGILHRSHQDPGTFLGGPLTVIPVPEIVVRAVAVATILTLGAWTLGRVAAWQRGELPAAHTLYVGSHVAMFATGYLLIEDLTVGWLVVNVWHNLQYLVIVWLYNTNRFRGGVDAEAPVLSRMSQPDALGLYVVTCLIVTVLLYGAIRSLVPSVAVAIIVSQSINFHHYLVDALIWKVRSPPLQRTLGLDT